MQNIELLLNPSVAPVYITATNMIYPVMTITFNSLYEGFTRLLEKVIYYGGIIVHTLYFMGKMLVSEFEAMDGTQKFLTIFCFYNLIMMTIINIRQEEFQKLKQQIKILQKQVDMTELLRNDNADLIMDELSVFRNETNLKISTLDKKIKKIDPKVAYLEREMKAFN